MDDDYEFGRGEYIHGMDETLNISIPFTNISYTVSYCFVSKTVLSKKFLNYLI